MTCKNCGAENSLTNQFCENCGTQLALAQSSPTPPPTSTEQRSKSNTRPVKIIAAIIAGVLGVICVCGIAVLATLGPPTITINLPGATTAAPRPSPTQRALATPTTAPILSTDPLSTTSPATTLTPLAGGPSPIPFKKWKTSQVVTAFQAAGLEFANSHPMTPDDYGFVPQVAAEGIRFFLPSLGGSKGGRIYSFATNSNLQSVKQYYAAQSGTPPWIFIRDNILVQIHSDLPKDRAKRYEDALNAIQ